ncbi:hypothetical protein ACL9RL_07420 [Plantibacter sp. Mn2098]|uniref:hypothetical protein n=1 Tax=Plantibacter sp. Mn2098 TaxID=3395266 RepID=UPI003BC250BB
MPSVTIHDVATFAPHAPTLSMEPNGWAVVKLPANFIASAEEHVITGTLLGLEARVRFTPVEYDFSYGDGAGLLSPSGGSTWNTLQLGEFSDTATSHVYTTSGVYTASVEVVYEAEYQFDDSDWLPVSGSLSVETTTPLSITAKTAKTVLVDRNCTQRTSGPGC